VASSVKAILIDSGRVLNRPATGHWFITPKFFEHVDKKIFPQYQSLREILLFLRPLNIYPNKP
jgi:putative hydrolase of the HAD superfamily